VIGLLIRRPMFLLLGFCLVLGAMAAFELTALFKDEQEADLTSLPISSPIVSGPTVSRPVNGRSSPDTSTSEQRQQRVVSMLARPLFASDRRPHAAAKVAARAAAVLPRLTGILIYGGVRRVLFARVDGEKPMAVSEGAEVANFRVQKIDAEQVTLLGPDGPRVVRPTFDPQAAAGLASVSSAPDSTTNVPGVSRLATGSDAGRPRVSAR